MAASNNDRDDDYSGRKYPPSGSDDFDSEVSDGEIPGYDNGVYEDEQQAYHVYGTYETDETDEADSDAQTQAELDRIRPSDSQSDGQHWYGPSSDPVWNATTTTDDTSPRIDLRRTTDTQPMHPVNGETRPNTPLLDHAPLFEDTAPVTPHTTYAPSTRPYNPTVTGANRTGITDTPASTPTVELPRRSRARDRVRRRKTAQEAATPAPILAREGTRAIPRAIASSARPSQVSRERLPRIDLSALPLNTVRLGGYALGALLLVVGVIVALSLFANDTPEVGGNAIWIGTEWTYDTRTDADVEALAARLRENQIGSVYAWVAWIPNSGEWSGGSLPYSEREPNILRFVNQFKRFYPEARLFAWLGVPVIDEPTSIPYRLNNTDFQQNVAEFSAYTINDLGFDGVHLNAEPVWDRYGEDFIQFINRVRLEIGQDAEISIVVLPDWTPNDASIPQPRSIVPGTVLSSDLKERLMLITDQVAVMAYNSGLTSPFDYTDWYAYQVETYAQAVEAIGGAGVDLLIGIPTYPNDPPGHDVNVENMFTALNGLRKGVEQAGNAGRFVTGAAIYGGWETDDTEWLQFQQGWVNR